MRTNKGQAALEFLMTYGWAILVVLIVIGALAYFGVLNPNILVPEKCTLQTGLACKDYRVTTNMVSLSLQNGMGKGIIISNITLNQTGSTGECKNNSIAAGTIAQSRNGEFVIYCTTEAGGAAIIDTGTKIKMDLSIIYYYQDSTSAYNHTMNGELLVKVES